MIIKVKLKSKRHIKRNPLAVLSHGYEWGISLERTASVVRNKGMITTYPYDGDTYLTYLRDDVDLHYHIPKQYIAKVKRYP